MAKNVLLVLVAVLILGVSAAVMAGPAPTLENFRKFEGVISGVIERPEYTIVLVRHETMEAIIRDYQKKPYRVGQKVGYDNGQMKILK